MKRRTMGLEVKCPQCGLVSVAGPNPPPSWHPKCRDDGTPMVATGKLVVVRAEKPRDEP